MAKLFGMQDWTIKVFSLLVSIILFLFVNLGNGTNVNVAFPLQYKTTDDIMLVSDAETKLTTTLRGPWASFRTFDDMPPVIVDLTGKEPGPVLYRLTADNIRVPAGMEVLSMRPYQLHIDLDRRVEKDVTVEVVPNGRPAFGYEIVDMRADPKRVRVMGPMGKVRTLNFVHTRAIDLADRDDDLSLEVELRPPLLPLRLVDRQSVMVFVDISEELSQRNLTLKVALENAPRGTRVTPAEVVVMLKGPRRIVDRLDANTLKAWVDVRAETMAGTLRFEKPIELRPELPERTQILGGAPKVEIVILKRRRRR